MMARWEPQFYRARDEVQCGLEFRCLVLDGASELRETRDVGCLCASCERKR